MNVIPIRLVFAIICFGVLLVPRAASGQLSLPFGDWIEELTRQDNDPQAPNYREGEDDQCDEYVDTALEGLLAGQANPSSWEWVDEITHRDYPGANIVGHTSTDQRADGTFVPTGVLLSEKELGSFGETSPYVFGVATHEAYHWAKITQTGEIMSEEEDAELYDRTVRCIWEKTPF